MREPYIVVSCDKCMQQDDAKRVVGVTAPVIAIDGSPARVLDLCAEHHKELIEPLTELLKLAGVPLGEGPPLKLVKQQTNGRPPSDSETDCPVCKRTFASRASVIGHLGSHGYDKIAASRIVMPAGGYIECEVCGYYASAAGSGLSVHQKSAHPEMAEKRVT